MGNYYKAASDNRRAITYNGRFSCMGKYINLYVEIKLILVESFDLVQPFLIRYFNLMSTQF